MLGHDHKMHYGDVCCFPLSKIELLLRMSALPR